MDTYRVLNGKEVETVGGPKQEIYNSMCAFAYFIDKDDDWRAEDIVSLHRMLMNGVDPDTSPALSGPRGSWSAMTTVPLRLCCPPEYVRSELESLARWLNGSPYDPIATGMVFVTEFSCIMPFKHGNSRVIHNMFQLILHDLGLNNIGLAGTTTS